MPIDKYGFRFPDGTLPETIELHAYRLGRTEEQGGLGKFQHLKNVIDLIWNSGKTSRTFIWSPWAEDMLRQMCDHSYVSVAGCASSGKSDSAAVWAIVEYLAGPTDTMVLVTSTTLGEARRRIWKSISELWNSVAPGTLPGKMVDSLGMIKGLDPQGNYTSASGIALVSAEKKKEKDAIGKLVGIKQLRVRMVADELPELPESIIHACYTNLDMNEDFRMVGLGNPSSRFDAFGVFSKPKDGWDSISEKDTEWETSRGICIRFDAYKCPNVIERKVIYSWMPTYEKVEQARGDYGEESLLFYRMFRGFWCPSGASSGVYSEADLTVGAASKPAKFDDGTEPVLLAALDPAFTHGGDRSVVYFGRMGMESGLPVLEFTGYEVLQEDLTNKAVPRTHQIVKQFKDLCVKRGVLPYNVGMDETGAGGPFADVMANEWSDRFLRVNFSGKATSRAVSASDRAPGHERYGNRVTEIWFAGQELLRSQQLRGIGDDLAREMVSREYTTAAQGRVKVESKVDYKSRIGSSPDVADAAFILIDLCRQRHKLLGGERFEVNQSRQKVWHSHMTKFDVTSNNDRSLTRL